MELVPLAALGGVLLATAVRETREELSLDLNATAHLLGRLDNLPAIARGRWSSGRSTSSPSLAVKSRRI